MPFSLFPQIEFIIRDFASSLLCYLLFIIINRLPELTLLLSSLYIVWFSPQKINSTCLSLNSLTATRHGVILDWQKLKIIACTHKYTWCVCEHVGYSYVFSFFGVRSRVPTADKYSESGVRETVSWYVFGGGGGDSKSQSNCFDTATRICCHFDANVSMWIARNIYAARTHANGIHFSFFIFMCISFAIEKCQQHARTRSVYFFREKKNAFDSCFIVAMCILWLNIFLIK